MPEVVQLDSTAARHQPFPPGPSKPFGLKSVVLLWPADEPDPFVLRSRSLIKRQGESCASFWQHPFPLYGQHFGCAISLWLQGENFRRPAPVGDQGPRRPRPLVLRRQLVHQFDQFRLAGQITLLRLIRGSNFIESLQLCQSGDDAQPLNTLQASNLVRLLDFVVSATATSRSVLMVAA